jgi:hypothetical protein
LSSLNEKNATRASRRPPGGFEGAKRMHPLIVNVQKEELVSNEWMDGSSLSAFAENVDCILMDN